MEAFSLTDFGTKGRVSKQLFVLIKASVVPFKKQEQMKKQYLPLAGELSSLGDDDKVRVGFYYRLKPKGLIEITQDTSWKNLTVREMNKAGKFQIKFPNLANGTYQFRAYTSHDKITVKGEIFEIKR